MTSIEIGSLLICLFCLFDSEYANKQNDYVVEVQLEEIEITASPIVKNEVLYSMATPATTYVTLSPGALIIDMGIVPQTQANALKPYGLIFDLIKNYQIEVEWIINPNKASNKNINFDDIDFSYNGTDFRGGPFIIRSEYRSTAINIAIDAWIAKGVQTVTTFSEVTVPVEVTLGTAPNWTLDFQNGHRLFDGFTAAEIPEFNDPGETDANYIFKTPAELNYCDYLYAMPHADPVWSTHANLYDWVLPKTLGGYRGWIYGACHAVSALENIFDDVTPDTTIQMNFLSNKIADAEMVNSPWADNSLVLWGDHSDGDGVYDYDNTTYTDPFMQFMGKLDGALDNGSEQIFMPHNGTSWRNTTTISMYDANQPDVGVISPGPAAQMAYGPAYGIGDYNDYSAGNGWILYLAGHEIDNSNTEAGIASYRAFFNFSFMSAFERGATLSYVANVPTIMQEGSTITLSATATGSLPPFTFTWTANPDVGSFTNNPQTVGDGELAEVEYTAPLTNSPLDVIITLSVKDQCNIISRSSSIVTIVPPPLPPQCSDIIEYIGPNSASILDLTDLTYDPNFDLFPSGFTLTGFPNNGNVVLDANAIATYYPDFNFIGTDSYEYTATDTTGLFCTGTVTLIIECPSDPLNNQIYGSVFFDLNANGLIDPEDYGFDGGALISLFKDDAPNDGIPDGPAIQDTISNIIGGYNFIVEDTYSQQISSTFYLGGSADDAREKVNGNKTGNVDINKNEHKISSDGDNLWNGFRFRNVTIPDGALIQSANIVFTAKRTNAGNNAHVRFYGQDNTSSPAQFTSCNNNCFDITSRPVTANYTNWNNIPVWIQDSQYSSPDIKNIIQEIVDDQFGLNNEEIVIITEALGPAYDERRAYSYDSDPSKAAFLEVTYVIVPAGVNFNYILEMNESDLPAGYVLTSPSSLTVTFDALGTSDCQNNFGFYVPTACPIIYTNGFIRYNRLN